MKDSDNSMRLYFKTVDMNIIFLTTVFVYSLQNSTSKMLLKSIEENWGEYSSILDINKEIDVLITNPHLQ